MFPMYLLPLFLFLIAFWLFHKASEDIYSVLAAAIAVICLIWGLALAPWVVQLGMVILAIALERLYFVKEG